MKGCKHYASKVIGKYAGGGVVKAPRVAGPRFAEKEDPMTEYPGPEGQAGKPQPRGRVVTPDNPALRKKKGSWRTRT